MGFVIEDSVVSDKFGLRQSTAWLEDADAKHVPVQFHETLHDAFCRCGGPQLYNWKLVSLRLLLRSIVGTI